MDREENQINDMEPKEAKNRTTRRKQNPIKREDGISHLWNKFTVCNICIIGVPEGEEKEQEIGNLLEKIMKENFPNLVRAIDM